MRLKNSASDYGLVAKAFHWIIAFLILGLLPVGLYMTGMANSPAKLDLYALHKSFGLLVFFLGVARIVWRIVSPPPRSLPNHQTWEKALAGASHAWLYVCVIGMPLSGWLMSSAGQFPIPFFGLHMPALMGKDEQLAGLFYQVHEILAYTLLAVLALHIAGALKHHVIDRDETLNRMASPRARLATPILIVLLCGLSFGASAFFLYESLAPKQQAHADEVQSGASETPMTQDLGQDGWAIVGGESTLSFETTLYGSPLSGTFERFSGNIAFNTDNLSSAYADIRIPLNGVKTGDESRDQTLQENVWFDTAQFPEARFEASKFERLPDGTYAANGLLTLRGVTLPVSLPFSLSIDGNTARMTSSGLLLDRLSFGIGKGEWEDEATVGHSVKVNINLTARR